MKRLLLLPLLLSASTAFALVDMKNANYTNSWTDMEVPGTGYDLKIVRAYNSRSLFSGMFGFGWCSDFETALEILPEGNLKVKECGDGSSTVYSAHELNRGDVDKTISGIISKMRAEKKVGQTESFYASLKTDLVDNDERRAALAKQYGISVPVKEGMKFSANGKEVEHFIFQKSYYTRVMADGSSQRFSPEGKLTAQYDKNGNFLKFEYDKDGVLQQITDNNSRRLSFKYYANKKVQKITGPNGLAAEYRFANLDDLQAAKNAWHNVYNYEYDDLHNMTHATWPDKTSVSLKYDKKNDWVVGFTDRDKCNEAYSYDFDPKDSKNHYWSTVKKTCGKETVADNRYEFWYKQRTDGQTYLHRVQTVISGNTTDITYHDVFGKPISIRRNTDHISYEYYPDGLVKAKISPASRLTYEYDPSVKKISKVTAQYFNDKGKEVGKRSTLFKYDGKGNLNFADNSDGQKITMTYDNHGRIASITDQAKKVVKIDYEERFGKPATVTRPGLGTITVKYKANGEIQNVESKEGPSVAMQVASTFNNLLEIISPATAELYL